MSEVRVKALEWFGPSRWSARHLWRYEIADELPLSHATPYQLRIDGVESGLFATAEQARSAAQADFERRVLSAIAT